MAAVDLEGDAGDEPGLLGAQEGDDGAEVGGVADAGRAGALAAVQRQQAVGGVGARQHRVHGHAVAGHLGGERLEEAGGAGPGGVREDQHPNGLLHGDRRDGDDPSPPPLAHRRHRRLAHGDDRQEVELERRPVGVERRRLEGARRRTAGVRDQDVRVRPQRARRRRRRTRSHPKGWTTSATRPVWPVARQRRHGVVDPGPVPAADGHPRTLGRQCLRRRQPEAGRSRRDRGRPAPDAQIHGGRSVWVAFTAASPLEASGRPFAPILDCGCPRDR